MRITLVQSVRITSALVMALTTSNIAPILAFAAPQNPTAMAASSKHETNDKNNSKGQMKKVTQPTTPSTSRASIEQPTNSQTTIPPVPATVAASPASVHNPAGNNGFIKVNEETVPDSIPNNDPHVGCTFKVEFYNYDANPSYKARVNFELHAPTTGAGYSLQVAGNQNPSIGGDNAGGGNDFDAVEAYKLTFTGTPHPQQGYHVKLTIHADGSRGADVKHKVFWVQPCETANTPNGHILTTSNSRPVAKSTSTLPAALPSTGMNPLVTLAMGVLTTMGAYYIAYFIQRFRARA